MNQGQPPGCLTLIFRLLGFRFDGIARAKNVRAPRPYRVRDDFLSKAEFSFYCVLKLAIKDRAVICPKVNLGDVFFVSKPNVNKSFRNKIDRKHVDFLACCPETMTPLFGVELDDKSHARADRLDRDGFVNSVFEAAGLTLLRFPAQAKYDVHQISDRLSKHMAGRTTPEIKPRPMDLASGQTPICSKCGVAMLRRTATKGQNVGKQFWGCPNYPRCREIA